MYNQTMSFTLDMKDAIPMPNNIPPLGRLPKNKDIYLRRSTNLYGNSETGKTTILMEIAHLLKDDIPIVYVVAPSNSQNHTYDGVVPQRLIKEHITREKLINIFRLQELKTELYKIVNNPKEIKPVFEAMKDIPDCAPSYYGANQTILSYEEKLKKYKARLARNDKLTSVQKEEALGNADQTHAESIVKIYKSNIMRFKPILSKYFEQRNTVEFKTIVDFIDLNPNIMLIFDDAMEILHELSKISGASRKNRDRYHDIISIIFSRGRHANITIICSAQDDNKFSSQMRKSAFVSIFTEMPALVHFASSTANGFDKKTREKVITMGSEVFAGDIKKNYKKFCYFRLGNSHNKFSYSLASIYPDFKLCAPEVRKFCEESERNKENRNAVFLRSVREKMNKLRII